MQNPTVDKIITELNNRTEYYGNLHQQQKVDDTFYELTYDAHVPESLGYHKVTPKTARDWVEVGAQHFTMDNPRAIVPPQSRSDAARTSATKMEAFYNAWLDKLPIQLKMAMKQLLKRGELFLKLWIDDYYYALDPKTKAEREVIEDRSLSNFPLIMDLPDPINVFCSPAHNGLNPVDVIECYEMTVAEAENLCMRNGWKWTNLKDKKSTDKVKWTSYYDAEYRVFLIDNEPILSPEIAPNILGFCPYIHIPAGYGSLHYEGKPEYLYRSVIYENEGMIEMWTRALSQADAIQGRYAWPKMVIEGNSIESIKRLYPDGPSMDPDQPIYNITDQVKVSIEQGASVSPQMYQHLGMVQELAEVNPSLSGGRQSGVYSGTHQQTMISYAKPKYKDPIKNFEDGLADFLGMGARVIDKVIKQPIAVRDVDAKNRKQDIKTISPKDINEYYYVKVSMAAELPEATDMRKAIGENAKKAGTLSHKTVLTEYFDKTDEQAEDEIAQILEEGFLNSPVVQEAVARIYAKRWDMQEVQKILDEEGLEQERGGDNRSPETVPTGLESIPSRGRTGDIAGMTGKTEMENLGG